MKKLLQRIFKRKYSNTIKGSNLLKCMYGNEGVMTGFYLIIEIPNMHPDYYIRNTIRIIEDNKCNSKPKEKITEIPKRD